MKKFLYIFLILIVISQISNIVTNSNNGKSSINEDILFKARNKFIDDWNRLIGIKSELMPNTIVVYVSNKKNPYKNRENYAQQYHPKFVNGQSCKELDIKFIQVRNKFNNELLSGIICND